MSGKVYGHYFYRASIHPKELGVGNIVWDYRVPTRNRPYQHGEAGEDLLADENMFVHAEHPDADVAFGDPREFSLEIGLEGVAWLGPHWKDEVKVRITADKMTEAHVQSCREDDLLSLVAAHPKARAWLQRNLSAAFTVGSMASRLFRRPKLWLCTGIVTADKGTIEVTHESTRGFKMEGSDPTGTVPVGAKIEASKSPSSTRKMDIAGKTVVAAQWMLLYCKNLQRRDPPDTPYMVELTTTYARDNVKGAPSTVSFISTESGDISRSEKGDVQLYFVSDDEDDDFDYLDDDESEEGAHIFATEGATIEDNNQRRPETEEAQKEVGHAKVAISEHEELKGGDGDAKKETIIAEVNAETDAEAGMALGANLLAPMFPETDSEDFREFEKALKLLDDDYQLRERKLKTTAVEGSEALAEGSSTA